MKYNEIKAALFMLLCALTPVVSKAQFATFAFWKPPAFSLKFTSSSQTIYASNCSGAATVQTLNGSKVATNVTSNLTVNLTTSGSTVFYSDSECTSPITSITITAGNNSQSFYFIEPSATIVTLKAEAIGYIYTTQAQTINTNPYVWVGTAGDQVWSTGLNWSGGSAPGSSNVAIFNGTCNSNCSPTITASTTIGGIRLNSYSGTITQGTSRTLTVQGSGWVQDSGTFLGSNANITINSTMKIVGGSFQSTSSVLTLVNPGPYNTSNYALKSPGTFNANGGTFSYKTGNVGNNFIPGSATYNNFTFTSVGAYIDMGGGTLTVAGNLLLDNSSYDNRIMNGTITVGGNFTTNGQYQGTGIIKLIGNASGQTISMSNGAFAPGITIETGSNPVTLSGANSFYGPFVVSSVGTFTSTGSTLTVIDNCGTTNLTPGNVTYNNLILQTACGIINLGGGTMNLAGSLTLTQPGYNGDVNSGTIIVGGNVTSTGPNPWKGSAIIKLNGNASGQTITGINSGFIPNITIDTGTNPVTLSGNARVNNYTVTSMGSFTSTSSTFNILGHMIVGSEIYNNITIGGGCRGTLNLTGTLNIGGDLYLHDTCSGAINGGLLSLSGNLSVDAWNGGNAPISFVGSNQQTITQTGGQFPSGNITINNSNGVKLTTNAYFNNGSQTTTVTAGSIDMAGFNLNLKGLNLNSNTLTKNGGTLTVNGATAGTGSLYSGTVNP